MEIVDPSYQIVSRGKIPGRFNVINGGGKVVNEQALTAEEAADLLKVLTKV